MRCVNVIEQAVHKVMRMAVLCKQNSDPVHASNLHAVSRRPVLSYVVSLAY